MARRDIRYARKSQTATLGSLNPGDSITELDGTAYRLFYSDSAGDIQELEHGTAGQILTSNGTSADVSWQNNSALAPVKWIDFVTGFATTPSFLSTIASGDVWQYDYTSTTLYRLIGPSEDSFYTNYSGSAVSGLVVSKAITY
ncbi:MAG: hypothetical protein ACW968_11610 [Candidatus Thorarchaeota archaeon]|jgi:hypothetical protein